MTTPHLYEISFTDGVGRCLVAARDILPLELIMSELPSVLGPEEGETLNVCFGCCAQIDEDRCPCAKCHLTSFCSEECTRSQVHAEGECKLFSERKVRMPRGA